MKAALFQALERIRAFTSERTNASPDDGREGGCSLGPEGMRYAIAGSVPCSRSWKYWSSATMCELSFGSSMKRLMLSNGTQITCEAWLPENSPRVRYVSFGS